MDRNEDRIAVVRFHDGVGLWQVVDRDNRYIDGDFARYPDAEGYARSLGYIVIADPYTDRVFSVDRYGPIHAWHAAHNYAEGPRKRKVERIIDQGRIVYRVTGSL